MSHPLKKNYDVIVIGAGAAGLMTAITAAQRGRSVLLIEHTSKVGEKIRISGGGRCNFTNLMTSSHAYISKNPHFVKSALAGYTQHDFIKMVESYKISYHEKTLGQLFCDGSSKQIIAMLLDQCDRYGVTVHINCQVFDVSKPDFFHINSSSGTFESTALVIACGGLSIPQIGASDFGYRVAKTFGHTLVSTRPALVPLTLDEQAWPFFSALSGVSLPCGVSYGKVQFLEGVLFTHRGLSGPAILQISSYLTQFNQEKIELNLLPAFDLLSYFMDHKQTKKSPITLLKTLLPARFIDVLASSGPLAGILTRCLADLKKDDVKTMANHLHHFPMIIKGSEGYKKAEVTAGGVQTNELSSKTMESKIVSQLYFVGEVMDVTGWLGGYNFQWAWSSGYAAGRSC